ncbi:MAG: hypothetical protein H7269_09780 [Cellulomonas sp.]|nr:hypothetical protein [Cellulomonas sp.]
MRDPAGLVALVAAALWIAYLVPHRLRHRQQLLESRADDRFSGALRVLAVTGRPGRDPRASESRSDSNRAGDRVSGRVVLLTPCRGIPVQNLGVVAVTEGRIVDRPHGTQDRITADAARRAAQRRSRRAASLARRGAAARRRGVLTLALVTISLTGWVVVGLTTVAVAAAVFPTVALAAVLVLGRRAVVQGQVPDAAWDRQLTAAGGAGRPVAAPVTGRAHHPSDEPTQIIARIRDQTAPVQLDDAAEASPEAAVSGGVAESSAPTSSAADRSAADSSTGPDDAAWSPVPVPRSTYTAKAAAPRREPIPLVLPELATSPPAAQASSDLDAPLDVELAGQASAAPADDAEVTAPELNTDSAPLDLDAILARRRAAG